MLVVLEKQEDQVSEQFLEAIGQLPDGKYLVTIREISNNSTRNLQERYFAMIDTIRDHQGDSRYVIHERFKTEQKVESTKDFTYQEWMNFIEAFKWWAFANLDVIL